MDWCITAILIGVATLIIYWFAASKRNYWKERGFPHVNSHILFGNFLDSFLGKKSFTEVINDVYFNMKGKKFGGFMQFTTPMLLIADPELINHVLIKDFKSFQDHKFSNDFLDEPLLLNLSSLKGDEWRSLRYKLAPTFTSGKLKMMFAQISECADQIVAHVEGQKGGPLDVRTLSGQFTMNVVASVAFGLKVDAHKEDAKNKRFVTLAMRSFKPSFKNQCKFFLATISPKLKRLLNMKLIDDEVSEFFTSLVRDTVKHRKETNEKRNDFLQLLLNLRDKESDQPKSTAESVREAAEEDRELIEQLPEMSGHQNIEITDELLVGNTFIFISGGAETTASGLSFALFQLSVNPQIQEKLFEELNSAVKNTGFTYKTINSLPYLDQVINEVLRLHPPAGMVERMCVRDAIIPGTDKLLQPGDSMIIPVAALHVDPDYWEDPLTFNPSRFEDPQSITKGVYMPFGAGPRFCIAQRLALQKMKVFTAKLVLNYRMKLSSRTQMPLKMMAGSFTNHVKGAQRLALQKMKVFTAKLVLNYRMKLSSRTQMPLKMMAGSFTNHVKGGMWVEFSARS